MSEKLMYSRSEIAEMAGVTIHTVSLWVKNGILPPKIPGTNRWEVAAVHKFIKTKHKQGKRRGRYKTREESKS